VDGARYFIAIVTGLAQFGVAGVVATTTARAASGTLRRNQWTGIRTPSTMRSDQAWMAGHHAAQRLTPLFFANAVAACALLALGVGLRWSMVLMTVIAVSTFATLIAIAIYAAIAAGRAAGEPHGLNR
jgi:SdpI/YfhL protein family